VPLNVEVNFIDINFGRQFQHVTDEINLAASLMIIQGRGNGIFDPTAMVTNQEAVTMFLRALGVPVDYSTAMVTARESGLNGIGAVPDAPMSRVNTARLIVNALYAMGMDPQISEQLAQSVLADFPDAGNLTGDERLALAICVYLGIFQGAAGGSLNPNQTLQRSQMASLAVRLQEVILGTQ
ncbi:MAG: S-layer homology domain-containing protein, partial [Oscillospiraceae bacterium]|nr:S-layer homology domain-containing protein [Oscillospiraceae bacterium]